MKKALYFFKNLIIAHPAWFFLAVALLWVGLLSLLNYIFGVHVSLNDLLEDARDMVFDLLVFGVLLSIYEKLREKGDKIERLHEEIDDYRGWDEKEATFRIVGAVRRLKKLGVSDIDLNSCFFYRANLWGTDLEGTFLAKAYLERANLREVNLAGATLVEANLQSANLQDSVLVGTLLMKANLEGANLNGASLIMANLSYSNLSTTSLEGANFHFANFQKANLQGAFLEKALLREANLQEADLQGAIVGKNWFYALERFKTKGREEIKQKYLIDENGVLREKQ